MSSASLVEKRPHRSLKKQTLHNSRASVAASSLSLTSAPTTATAATSATTQNLYHVHRPKDSRLASHRDHDRLPDMITVKHSKTSRARNENSIDDHGGSSANDSFGPRQIKVKASRLNNRDSSCDGEDRRCENDVAMQLKSKLIEEQNLR